MHILCTICSDLVNQTESIYVTKCGHIFHHHCLAQWIERSKSCPQCRNKVTEKCMHRLYPTVSNEATGDDAATLQSRLDDAELQLRQQKATCREKDDMLKNLHTDLKRNEDLLKSYEKKLVTRDSAVMALKEQLEYVKAQNMNFNKVKEENERLCKANQTLLGLQKVLNATAEDVEHMLKCYTDVKTIAIFATALKRALCESESKKNESRDRLHAMKQQLAQEKSNAEELQVKIMQLEDRLAQTESRYVTLKRKASDKTNKTTNEETPVKLRKSGSFDLNTAILVDSNTCDTSVSLLVKKIENADSPYLNLKQSYMALSTLASSVSGTATGSAIRVPNNSPEHKAAESAFLKLARARSLEAQSENHRLSIFYKKQRAKADVFNENIQASSLDLSYDGLGGHSKLDVFPKPQPKFRSSIPKLSAKHKLKRPAGTQDIGKLFESMDK